MHAFIRILLILALVTLPAGIHAAEDIVPEQPHPIKPEDRIHVPKGDGSRFDGYEGEACPYHLNKSLKVLLDEVVPLEHRDKETMYSFNVYLKNYSPCLFANFHLHMRMTDPEGDVVDERDVLVEYVPSYSSNIVKENIWLPVHVDPGVLNVAFSLEQLM